MVPGMSESSQTRQRQTWWGRRLKRIWRAIQMDISDLDCREKLKIWLVHVTFAKSVEVFWRRKNGVKLMRRDSRSGVGQTRKPIAAVGVMRVYALPRWCKAKTQVFGLRAASVKSQDNSTKCLPDHDVLLINLQTRQWPWPMVYVQTWPWWRRMLLQLQSKQ